MSISKHLKNIHFMVMISHAIPFILGILGLPWFARHDPHVSWSSLWILQWGTNCFTCFLLPATEEGLADPQRTMAAIESILPQYRDLAEVFSKRRAASLPPHCLYETAINLLPGATLPCGWLYSLAVVERK